jgi:hypothetical protein
MGTHHEATAIDLASNHLAIVYRSTEEGSSDRVEGIEANITLGRTLELGDTTLAAMNVGILKSLRSENN